MKNLFLFTISPVQSFIAQARKSQDLFAGSKLLSSLCRTAINKINSLDQSCEIIFPANWKNDNAALPNRFLAELDIAPDDRLKLGQDVEEAVRIELVSIARDVFRENARGQEIPPGFMQQIEDHLVIHWLFEEMEGKSYFESYQNIESNLGAIKNVRLFDQLPATEAGRKDSLSGELNALIFNKKFKKPAFTESAILLNLPGTLLSEGEGLSALGFTKRFYKYSGHKSFPSTAEIAQLDIKAKLEDLPSFVAFKNFFSEDFDYQLLYKENHTENYFEKHDLKINSGGLDYVKEIFKKIKIENQKKYYAILIFDGDDMGKWLSGKYLGDFKKDDVLLKKYHTKVSALLAEFAAAANALVDDENLGRTIFAGGDDFLALLNLDNIFSTLSRLRMLFDEKINQKLKQEFSKELDEKKHVSFSAGLCISHYKAPLGAALGRARSMEQKAKQVDGKNAIAIAVMKHSGEVHETAFKWGEAESKIKNLDVLQETQDALKNKIVSPAFIQNLKATFLQLGTEDELQDKGNHEKIFDLELSRFLQKATIDKKCKQKAGALADKLICFRKHNGTKPTLDVLHIIDFIYRKA